ncbi:uncharacterized protein LOC112460420 [Temnothorax curvispinosus]|uniref:Uncharacterized protein LOC112460420 n=1 Tax=Temnothorax curvispinosus TaxID=300111 RepID=A0A6J1QGA8_9HYME|nr:uncharacterized protein LOC112460420 [Temnothorax curvispinosus]
MVNDKKFITDLQKIKSTIRVAKANETMTSEGIGTVDLEICTLKDVMYISDLSANLLSVSAITKNGGKVIFTEDKVVVEKDNMLEDQRSKKDFTVKPRKSLQVLWMIRSRGPKGFHEALL